MKIHSRRLTTCSLAADGTTVGLEFLDRSGTAVTVQLPLDQAEAVVMTLPRLLTRAVRQSTGNEDSRYVFNLGGWSIESTEERACLIATLSTTDGFEVSFSIPFEECQALGWHLQFSSSLPPSAGSSKASTRSFAKRSRPCSTTWRHKGRLF